MRLADRIILCKLLSVVERKRFWSHDFVHHSLLFASESYCVATRRRREDMVFV